MLNKNLLYIIVFVALLAGVCFVFMDIVVYLLIAGVLTIILSPIVDRFDSIRLGRFDFPRFLAVIIAYSTLFGVLGLFVMLFVPLVNEQIDVLQGLSKSNIEENANSVISALESFLIDTVRVNKKEGFVLDWIEENRFNLLSKLSFSNLLNSLVSFTGGILVTLMAVMFISFFFLMEKGMIRNLILNFIPNAYFEVSVSAYYKIKKLLTSYLAGLAIQMLVVFSLVAIMLSIFGVKYALTIAVFASIANLIPYVGPILGASFGILVGITTSKFTGSTDYIWLISKVAISFGVVQLLDNILLQPVIFSKSVKAHPLEIFVIIFVGATIAGPLGMIVAIPAYTAVRVFVRELYKGLKMYRVFSK